MDGTSTTGFRGSRAWRRVRRAVLAVVALGVRVQVWMLRRRYALPGVLDRLDRYALPAPAATADDAWVVVDRLFVRGRSGLCLVRSLVLFGLLRAAPPLAENSLSAVDSPSAGRRPVQFCLGVAPEAVRVSPQFAHAWVEAGGVAVGESADPRDTHRLIFQYPGRGDE